MELEVNKNFLIFPKLESKHIYIIIFVISSFLRTLIPSLIENSKFAKVKDNNNKVYFKEICYFDLLTNFISDISVGIYKLISLFKEKEKNNKITTSEGIKTKQNMLRLFFQILLLIALIDICAQLCLYVFSYIDPKGVILGIGKDSEDKEKNKIINEYDLFFIVGIDILFRYIFSRIILKSFFYKHHYLSMALNAIGFVPLIIINMKDLVINYDKAEENDDSNKVKFGIFITYIILYIIRTILYSLEDVYNKIALNKLLLRPYELMLYKALFEIIPIIIISTISINSSNFSDYINENLVNSKLVGRLLYRLFFIICNIFRTISLITIIEKINPNSLSILKSLEFISFFIYITFKEKIWNDPLNIIFESISCIILLLGALIHNEIIIINKWKFLECTDYYKCEIKSFSNIDINNSEEKINRAQESLISESNSQEVD